MTETTQIDAALLMAPIVELATLLAANGYNVIEKDDSAFEIADRESQMHLGAKSRVIDVKNRRVATSWRIHYRSPWELHLESEEASEPWHRPNFDQGEKAPYILRIDEFDGTTIATGTATNWSSVVVGFFYSERRKSYKLAGAAIACHDGHFVQFYNTSRRLAGGAIQPSGDVKLGRFDLFSGRVIGSIEPPRLSKLEEVEQLPGERSFVAISAAAGGERGKALISKYAMMLTDTKMRTLTAGSPIIYGALRGRLGVIVDPGRASIHDSAHLLILEALGWKIYDADTLKPINAIRIAEDNCIPGWEPRPFPPTLAVRDESDLLTLAAITSPE